MLPRLQKPTLRDFLLSHAQTRSRLCMDHEIFDPIDKLPQLSSFEKATLMSWSVDSNVDSGLNLYIVLHILSSINNNSCYYHYVNNGNPDGTNMFGHIIGTSGSGKSSALTPHMDALAHTLAQMDVNQEYIQYPNKNNALSFEQPFIISNSTALHVYRSLMYGNRLLCSTECDTLLSNLGAYGNQYNDPRFAENVNMLIQMFDGTKHQNRSTLSTSYNIPEGRRASIIGASVGDPYARVSQQHYEGNGISGAHNRFTHYPCPIMKAIKTNSGSTGVISNMVPSLQHVYTVSILLGKVEYVARQNIYDKSERKQTNIFSFDVEAKWERLRATANREYRLSPSQIEIELDEPEANSTFDQSYSAFYYMFNRVYNQWQEATLTDQQEHEAIINLKNSTKIPRFICNFARFRSIMNILWHDDVYPLIEISEVAKAPYCVSNSFIAAVNNVIDKLFPTDLRKADGTKILVIEKDTAIMGDLFFAHVDQVSRQLFDLSSIQQKFNSSLISPHLSTKNHMKPVNVEDHDLMYDDASFIISSKFIFFSASSFVYHRRFHNKKERLIIAIEYLIANGLIYQPSDKTRLLKGAHTSYAMLPPSHLKDKELSMAALTKLNLSIDDYVQIWQQCLLPTPELSSKIEKTAINYIKLHLNDYISIIHRLGNAFDPVAQEIIKPGLYTGKIGIDFDTKSFSLEPEYLIHYENDDDVMKQLSQLCMRANNEKNETSNNIEVIIADHHSIATNMSNAIKNSRSRTIDYNQLQAQRSSSAISADNFFTQYNQTNTFSKQGASPEENTDNNIMGDCVFVLEIIKAILDDSNIDQTNIQHEVLSICPSDNNKSPPSADSLSPTVSNNTSSIEKLVAIEINNKTIDSFSSIEYDHPTTDSIIINGTNHGLFVHQQPSKKSSPTLSSSIILENDDGYGDKHISSNSMEIECHSNCQTSPSAKMMSTECNNTSEDLNKIFDVQNVQDIQQVKKFDNIALAKKIMLKPFITFTRTDATRLYNNAETKNVVIGYLKEHGLIMEIDDLFLSTNPTKRTLKGETGYLKLFPASQSPSVTALFEEKLREKVGVTFDDYLKKILDSEDSSTSTLLSNNIFNTTCHNWLLNRHWYDKLRTGHISEYYRDKITCPDANISLTMVTIPSVSNDNVHDSFDRPRSKSTASQRTAKELRRLGAKRQKGLDDEPAPKRQRKQKRFADDD